MKINQSAVSTQPKLPIHENTEKAGASEKSDESGKAEENGVMFSVSQRNAVEVSNEMPEKPAGGIKHLLERLLASPDNTATAHAGLSPERVLQLLA